MVQIKVYLSRPLIGNHRSSTLNLKENYRWSANKMAKEYFEKLSKLITQLDLKTEYPQIEIKHFFSGAALYVNGKIRITLSPVGLAFKLPDEEIKELIASGRATHLKYFPQGNIKKGYALFELPDLTQTSHWKKYFVTAIQNAA